MNGSGINTILIIAILIVLIGGGIWWYMSYGPGAIDQETGSVEINLN